MKKLESLLMVMEIPSHSPDPRMKHLVVCSLILNPLMFTGRGQIPHQRIQRKIDNFKRLWNNLTPKLSVLDFPVAAKQKLLEYKPTSPSSIELDLLTADLSAKESGKSYSYRLKAIDLPPHPQTERLSARSN